MTHPLQGTLENFDGAWVLTLVRDFDKPAEKLWLAATWSASTHRMSWCTDGATTWCAGAFRRPTRAAG